jgi:hypothetical protein
VIKLPDDGIEPSRASHNSNLGVMTDWIEASVLLDDDDLSQYQVADALSELNVYNSQDFALEFLQSVWAEIDRRVGLVGEGVPFRLDGPTLGRTAEWEEVPAYTFLLILSLVPTYTGWRKIFGADYTEQGAIFEALTECSLRALFPMWRTHLTGWSRQNATIGELLPELVAEMGEQEGKYVALYAAEQAKDSGVDVILYRPFKDHRPGRPIFLGQCASGANWPSKIKEPDLDIWEKLIDFGQKPARAFFIPFSLPEEDFVPRAVQVTGMLLDRYRLLAPMQPENEWIEEAVADRLRDWLRPRVEWLQAQAAAQRGY